MLGSRVLAGNHGSRAWWESPSYRALPLKPKNARSTCRRGPAVLAWLAGCVGWGLPAPTFAEGTAQRVSLQPPSTDGIKTSVGFCSFQDDRWEIAAKREVRE